jgi:hypothetical protein
MFDSVARAFPWSQSEFVGQVESNGVWSPKQRRLVSLLELSARAQVPVALLGTAFCFVQLLDHLSANGLEFRLPPGSRVLETGGYKGRTRALPKADLHAWITRALGVPAASIVSEYGMCELGSQAYDRRVAWPGRESQIRAGLFRFPPWARAQVLSPETRREVAEGETGLVRVYDLANVASSVGVQTEDLGVRRRDGFELVGRAPRAEPRGCSLLSVGASES